MKRTENLWPTIPTFFDDFFTRDWFDFPVLGRWQSTVPAVNIRETNDCYELEIAAPGMSKKDFHVTLDNDMLIISAEREHKDEESNNNYTRREFSYHSFKRTFTLPKEYVEADKITAKYKDGILYVTIPKTEEAKTKPAKEIAVN